MTTERPENQRDDEILNETTEPTPAEGEPLAPDLPESSDDVELPADDDAELDVAPELTPEVPTANLEGVEAAVPEPPVDPAVGQDSVSTVDPPSETPNVATKTDWSNFEPAPGYADPETGRPVFRYGKIDQAGLDLMLLANGLRPVFEPEFAQPGDEPTTPPPPFLAEAFQQDAGPPSGPGGSSAGGAAPTVSVEVRVRFSDEGIKEVSKEPLRRAAQFSRDELLIVARKLEELCLEIEAREHQRSIQARRY